MIPRDIPNATPRPGQLALEVIQVGYLRGLLLHSGSQVHVDGRFFENPRVEEWLLRSATSQAIRAELHRVPIDRCRYIEQFIALVEHQAASGNAEAQQFVDVVKDVQRRCNLAHPIGLGLAAVHLYQQEARAT